MPKIKEDGKPVEVPAEILEKITQTDTALLDFMESKGCDALTCLYNLMLIHEKRSLQFEEQLLKIERSFNPMVIVWDLGAKDDKEDK